MVSAFKRMVEHYRAIKKPYSPNKDEQLTHNQKCNFQKLKHLGLAQFLDEGAWIPTAKGQDFFDGKIKVLTPAASIENETLSDDHQAWKTHTKPRRAVSIDDYIEPKYKRRVEYSQEKSSQRQLF